MKLHPLAALSFFVLFVLQTTLTSNAQSPGSAPARGKNGSVQERKVEATSRDGVPQGQAETLRIQTVNNNDHKNASPPVEKGRPNSPESPRLGSIAKSAKAPKLPEGRWWWDADSH